MTKALDLTGQRFGLLTVTGRAGHNNSAGGSMWECSCDCGGSKTAWSANLKRGLTNSCGCIRRAQIIERNRETRRTHGMTGTPEYRAWSALKDRATNPKSKDARNYSERGISLCDRWHAFEDFFADMGPRPSSAHSIDRIDNDRGYEPGNCRWATKTEQGNNRRTNIMVEHSGETKTLWQWAKALEIAPSTLYARYRKGLRGHHLFLYAAQRLKI